MKQPRIVDHEAGKAKVYQRERACRVCGDTRVSRHHLVGRGVGGDDVEANIVPVCGDGVLGCHGGLTDGHQRLGADGVLRTGREIRVVLRAKLRPEEVAYVLDTKGADWLDRTYPPA
jgi:hypothetical protein